jgi:hypothetical protein
MDQDVSMLLIESGYSTTAKGFTSREVVSTRVFLFLFFYWFF